jgi:hypothetical protein
MVKLSFLCLFILTLLFYIPTIFSNPYDTINVINQYIELQKVLEILMVDHRDYLINEFIRLHPGIVVNDIKYLEWIQRVLLSLVKIELFPKRIGIVLDSDFIRNLIKLYQEEINIKNTIFIKQVLELKFNGQLNPVYIGLLAELISQKV